MKRLVLLVVAYAVATWLVGWVAVPAVAAAWGILRPGRAAWWSGLAAGLAWSALLGLDALTGPLGRLAGILGAMLDSGPAIPLLIVPVFAALLGWSATRVAAAIRGRPPV